MYERILLPTDGSEVGESAASQAIALAAATGARLHVLSVVDAEAIGIVTPVTLDLDEVRTSLRHAGEEATAAVAEAAGAAGVDVVEAVEVGVPDEEIRDYAATHDVDLVVMGTHGRGGVDRFLLGSVTERVVRGSAVPVLAVPPTGADPVLMAEAAIERARAAVEDGRRSARAAARGPLPGAHDVGRPPGARRRRVGERPRRRGDRGRPDREARLRARPSTVAPSSRPVVPSRPPPGSVPLRSRGNPVVLRGVRV